MLVTDRVVQGQCQVFQCDIDTKTTKNLWISANSSVVLSCNASPQALFYGHKGKLFDSLSH